MVDSVCLEDINREAFSDSKYIDCTIKNSVIAEVNFSHISFEDCIFSDCDLSNCKLGETSFKNVQFQNCKMIGMQFLDCRTFLLEMHFDNCVLNYSSFYGVDLKHSTFKNCSLIESDFRESDMEKLILDGCDLLRAEFYQTNLKSCDFSNASNYSLDPENNKIAQAKFSLHDVVGLLTKYDINIKP